MIYIGIDPGIKGAISSIIQNESVRIVRTMPMAITEADTRQSILFALGGEPEYKAIIEKVHAFPGQGVTSMFTFGQNYGFLRGCLVSLGIPFEEVTPQKWQKEFGLSKKKNESKTDYKKRILQKAQNLFPEADVKLQTADSLMLAEYLRRQDVK